MNNNLIVAERLLKSKSINVKYTKNYLKDTILSHPDYPSLLSISDTLKDYNIKTLAAKIDFNKLKGMPMPCIVQIEANNQFLFYVLEHITDSEVSYFYKKREPTKMSKNDFLDIWTGITLLIEKTERSEEKGIREKILVKRIYNYLFSFIVIFFTSWVLFSFFNSELIKDDRITLFAGIYGLIKIAGLIISIFLLWFEIDQYNPILQNFCSGNNKKVNCNAVLNSKYSNFFNGHISLGILCFSYFFSTILCAIFYRFSIPIFSTLGMFSLISLPFVFTSIYYQAFKIKQWCKFCILIQLLLLFEIGITFLNRFYSFDFQYESIVLLIATFLFPILSWKIIKPLLKKKKDFNLYKRGFRKIKNNPEVFKALLSNSKKIHKSTEGLGISFFNESAKYNIIKVCNPYCSPCAKAHPILDNLFEQGKINLQILFNAKDNSNAKPVHLFLAVDAENDKQKTLQTLNDWYHSNQKDYEIFSQKHEINKNTEAQEIKVQEMRKWCESQNITHTPTFFINGYELPNSYNVQDLEDVLH